MTECNSVGFRYGFVTLRTKGTGELWQVSPFRWPVRKGISGLFVESSARIWSSLQNTLMHAKRLNESVKIHIEDVCCKICISARQIFRTGFLPIFNQDCSDWRSCGRPVNNYIKSSWMKSWTMQAVLLGVVRGGRGHQLAPSGQVKICFSEVPTQQAGRRRQIHISYNQGTLGEFGHS